VKSTRELKRRKPLNCNCGKGVGDAVPKMKTVKAIKARVRVTANGKLKRGRPGRRHLLSGKTSKRKRQLRRAAMSDHFHEKVYSRLMGV
jgi:large subunit ribosomal protein L35